MAGLGSDVIVRFLGDTKALDAAIKHMETKLNGFGAVTAKAAGISMAFLGSITALGAASVKTAAQFQQSMELLATQAGVPQAQIAKLSQAVLDLAPKVGTGPDQLAQALFHIESTLSQTLPASERFTLAMQQLKIAAEGAKVGNADLVDVTNALNATMSSGMVPMNQMSQAMGALNAIVGSGDMHMQDLAEAMGSGVLAVIKNYGVSLQDAGAALATFGDNNVRGADAATMLRMSVQNLAVPAKGAAKALAQIKLDPKNLAKDLSTGGLGKALDDLHTHLVQSGIAANKWGEILTAAFSKKAGPGLAVLIDQFSRFQSKQEEVAAGAGGFNAAWDKTTKTAACQWSQLTAQVKSLSIEFGKALLPLGQQVLAWAKSLTGWVSDNRAEVLKWTKVLAGVAAGFVALRVGIIAYKAAVEVATLVQKGFNLAMTDNPIGLVIKGLALLAAGVVYAYEKFDGFRKIVKEAMAGAVYAVEGMVNLVLGYLQLLITAAAKAAGFLGMHGLAKDLNAAAAKIQSWRDSVNNSLNGVIKDLVITVHVQKVTDAMRSSMTSVYNSQVPKFTAEAKSAGKKTGDAYSSGVASGVGAGKSKVQTALDNLKKSMTDAAKQISDSLVKSLSLSSIAGKGGTYTNVTMDKNGRMVIGTASVNSGGVLAAEFAQQVSAMKVFAGKITQLRRLGLNSTMLNEIVSAGVAKGGALADDLLSSKSSIRSLNSSEAQLQSIAGGIGSTAASAEFLPQILAAMKQNNVTLAQLPGVLAQALNSTAKSSQLRGRTVTGRA